MFQIGQKLCKGRKNVLLWQIVVLNCCVCLALVIMTKADHTLKITSTVIQTTWIQIDISQIIEKLSDFQNKTESKYSPRPRANQF